MAVEQSLAQLSNTLIYSSMLVYTGALGAFVTDLAARGAQADRARLAEPAKELAHVGAPSDPAAAGAEPGRGDAAGPGIAGGRASRWRSPGWPWPCTWAR